MNSELNYIQGFLDAFAWINHKTNHGYSFQITLIEKNAPIEEVIETYITNLYTTKEEIVKYNYLHVKTSWKKELEKNLIKWLFQFQSDQFGGNHFLKDQSYQFSLSKKSFVQIMLKEFIKNFESIGVDFQPYNVQIDFENGLYEVEYNDLLLLSKRKSILLHLGQSD